MSIRYFSVWTKRTGYMLQSHNEKGTYVTDAHSSELVTYDPFSCADDILLELLTIGRQTAAAPSDFRVLDFCIRYGLLGFGQAVIEKEYENATVKLYADNVLGEKLLTDQELMDLIFPFDKYSHRVIKGEEMPVTLRWEIDCGIKGSKWPLFDDSYAERGNWIADYARRLYDTLAKHYRQEPFEYPLGNIKYKLVGEEGVARTVWLYDSLKSAIDIMFVQLLQHPSPAVKLCKRCLTPFRAVAGTRAAYCSVTCRNVLNVKNSRQRKKNTT